MHMNNLSTLEIFEREILQAPRTSYNVQLRLYDIFIPTLGTLIMVLNLMVLVSSGLILRKQPRSTYLFLGNIALADFMTGAMTIFGQYYPRDERSEMICCFQIGMIISATLASIYSIALIAIDRYLYILNGLQYQRYVSMQRAWLMALSTWILGFIVGFLPAMGVRNPIDNGTFCWLIILEPPVLLLTTAAIGVLPLGVIIVLYGIILRKAMGKISEMKRAEAEKNSTFEEKRINLRYFRGGSNHSNNKIPNSKIFHINDNDNAIVKDENNTWRSKLCCCASNKIQISAVYSPSRWKAIKIVFLTTGCYFVTWVPYFFACTLYTICDLDEYPERCNNLRLAIASPLAILGLANSLLNPIIYAWWHNGFRESAKKIYARFWRIKIKPKLPTQRKPASKKVTTPSNSTSSTTQASTISSTPL